jgi:uncharacterized membrane protein
LATYTSANGINDKDVIAGQYRDATGLDHGFTYSNSTFNSVDVIGASQSFLTRVKNTGNVTGGYIDALGENHGIKGH